MRQLIGHTFSTLRKRQGIHVKELTAGIISESEYYRFVNGTIDISMVKFLLLLSRLNISFEEFAFLSENIDVSKPLTHFSKGKSVSLNNATNFKLSITFYQSHAQIPPKPVIEKSISYLLDSESWTYDDLLLFSKTIYFFPCKQRLALLQRAIKGFKKYNGFKQNIADYFKFLCQLLLIAWDRKDLKLAKKFMHQLLEMRFHPNDFFELSLQSFFKAVLLYLSEPTDNNRFQIRTIVESFKHLNLLQGESSLLIKASLSYLELSI
ncbi:Rgg/GadR/MutR family transcriptional regulator [Lentilactobacillus farraginis]|nr:Rgg/GadR/MutR family transcriptional regulator [Lentilactobacillus farraginis]GAF36319.1 RopB protein [Lentilactobacillus farraginis DSM 18382 = JCM 14108]